MLVHRSTGATPFELVLSRPPPPFDLHHSTSRRLQGKAKFEHADYVERLETTVTKARANLSAAQERYKRDFEKRIKHKLTQIEAGDWVSVDPVQRTGPTNKLTPTAVGPYRILSTGRGAVVIKRKDRVERINRSPVKLTSPPDNPENVDEHDPTDADFAEKTIGEEWVVREVKDHDRDYDGNIWFHIEWAGNHDDSW